jgi:maltooligosyltrehalose trehalohydrolase
LSARETFRRTGTLGAVPLDNGGVRFRVWAPAARTLAVRIGDALTALADAGDGFFAGEAAAHPGDDYTFVLDGGTPLPDPCSRLQPDGMLGPSRVVDTAALAVRPFDAPALDELVLYELHVGTFSPQGTFDGVIPRLAELRELGVTAIELMPIATFAGNRNWGYDGVYTSAPHPAYGGPQGLARLVDAAHREGLAVLVDVVYNHIGPGHEAIAPFGPYFTDRHETFWGKALDYTQTAVREWAIQNAELWVRDYHVDGLRLDAVHALVDDSPRHVLAELRDRVKALNPRALVISEAEPDELRPIREWGHDAQWADGAHHELHVLLTGQRDGYYSSHTGSADALADALRGAGDAPQQLVVYAQNHDQVGNRALGDRLPPDALRVAAAVTLFSPCTPLLFMGEDYGERRPFRYFTDHVDPATAAAARDGRRREFAAFSAFSEAGVPDPQDKATFERSKLSWQVDAETRTFYERLLRLRRELPRRVTIDADGTCLRMRRGDVELTADFDAKTVHVA